MDPPDGVSLASVPKDLLWLNRKVPIGGDTLHGQQLFWGDQANLSVRSVTELTKPHRCKDKWYNEFPEECRNMKLSKDNHAFLHGEETTVPGSWLGGANGDVGCRRSVCRKLVGAWKTEAATCSWSLRKEKECEKCKAERKRRCRVAKNEDHEEFHWDKYLKANLVVANNDVKYDTNKTRAQHYAHHKKEQVLWCVAKDKATVDALKEDPSLPTKKLEWLKRHDRECGNLYGMPPLVRGMPMTLTDHLDRSPDRNLLRGRVGTVHSWILHEDDHADFYEQSTSLKKLPEVVFLKFKNAKWKLEGMTEAGVYPIKPVESTWALDRRRKFPRLKIIRKQLPLAPAFCMTAHASQGMTMDAAIVDLRIGKESSPLHGYVALSRVKKAEDILIFRPFDIEIFQRTLPVGPELLLRKLRGEGIDWEEWRDKLEPKGSKFRRHDGKDVKEGEGKAERERGLWGMNEVLENSDRLHHVGRGAGR